MVNATRTNLTSISDFPCDESKHSDCRPSWLMRPPLIVVSDLLGCMLVRRFPDGEVIQGEIANFHINYWALNTLVCRTIVFKALAYYSCSPLNSITF
jgi:hypothetical protein